MRKTTTVQKVPFLSPDVITKVIPAPTDGWDAISPLAEMDPKRAPILDNWVPRPGYVELRGGSAGRTQIDGSHPVETLMVRRSPTGEKMFAACNGKIFDVSVPAVATQVVTGLTSNRWQYTNFTPGNGIDVIQLCNGFDPLYQYDGTSWTNPSITSIPAGYSVVDIINIAIHKRRIWYVLNNSSIVMFMPTDAITGAIAGAIDFGALWTKGGYLVASASWTIDGGNGPQDYAVFISSRGQITIYSGTDPTSSTAWSLVGTFDIAPPIGRRCTLRVGSDLAIITEQGVLPISQALPFDPSADRSVAITARIQNAMAAAAQSSKGNFGWQFISFPLQQLAILNVPLDEGLNQVQFVMNTLTGAWCRFTGWGANCFEIFNDNLYFGGNVGNLCQGYVGSTDYQSAVIQADMQCAFNWLDQPGRVKRMTMLQTLLITGGIITPTIAVDTDFSNAGALAPVSTYIPSAQWDVAAWDGAAWPTTGVNVSRWLSITAVGYTFAIRMKLQFGFNSTGVFDVGQFDQAQFGVFLGNSIPVLQVNAFTVVAETGGVL